MSFLVPVMMWGWIPATIILFRIFPAQKAILISVIGGVLFLPVSSFDLPMIEYNKNIALGVSLFLGIIFSGEKPKSVFKFRLIDLPIIIFCVLSPFLSIITNGLGIYNAVSSVIETCLTWGVFYMAGRIYFQDNDALRKISTSIIIGGLIYVPLIFFELRMSPQLSNIVYGFFPHSFAQHVRDGGYRPIVFMNHGLMVALWMSVASITSLWLFGTKEITKFKKVPMIIIVPLLLLTTILCKCSGAIVLTFLGIVCFLLYKKMHSLKILKFIIFIIPLYIILRLSDVLSADTIILYLSRLFNEERITSLSIRLFQEQMFGSNALRNPFFGWGWMDKAWPMDILTGNTAIPVIDSFFLIVFSIRGFFGLISLYLVLLLGPWRVIKYKTATVDAVVLSVVIIMFSIDTLLNAFPNPVYILVSGSLISYSENLKNNELKNTN